MGQPSIRPSLAWTNHIPLKPPGQQAERLALVGGGGWTDPLVRQAFDLAADGLAVLVEKRHDVITVLSRDGVIEHQSASCLWLTGFAPAELVGRNVFDLAHPDDVAELRQLFGTHLAEPHRVIPDAAEARFRHKAGGWCWIEIVATNAFDGPAVKGLVVVSRGIDRRKAVEAEIAANRARLDFSLDAARVGGGPWHWVHARGRVSARAADGRVTRLGGVMMGIGERRRAVAGRWSPARCR